MSELTINNVSKTFVGQQALNNVTLQFSANRVTAIIGRSGCGKSTLLKVLNGLERPDNGSVYLFGSPIDYTALATLRKKIGYAVQGVGLFPHLTIKQNIVLLADLSNWCRTAIEQRLEHLLQLMQLQCELLVRYPHELSGGQQQRVGLCRAMMLDPPVLLLDEAFAALDPLTRVDIHQQLLKLQQTEPRTTILVTHDMQEALTLADNIVVMEKGRITLHHSKDLILSQQPHHDDANALLLSLMTNRKESDAQ